MNNSKVYCMDAGFDGLCVELGQVSLNKKRNLYVEIIFRLQKMKQIV